MLRKLVFEVGYSLPDLRCYESGMNLAVVFCLPPELVLQLARKSSNLGLIALINLASGKANVINDSSGCLGVARSVVQGKWFHHDLLFTKACLVLWLIKDIKAKGYVW